MLTKSTGVDSWFSLEARDNSKFLDRLLFSCYGKVFTENVVIVNQTSFFNASDWSLRRIHFYMLSTHPQIFSGNFQEITYVLLVY